MGERPTDEKTYWLDNKRNHHRIFWVLVAVCAALFLADGVYHKHTEFYWEEWFGFYGLFGFCLSFLLVLTAKGMRKILMRDEDYYGR